MSRPEEFVIIHPSKQVLIQTVRTRSVANLVLLMMGDSMYMGGGEGGDLGVRI